MLVDSASVCIKTSDYCPESRKTEWKFLAQDKHNTYGKPEKCTQRDMINCVLFKNLSKMKSC